MSKQPVPSAPWWQRAIAGVVSLVGALACLGIAVSFVMEKQWPDFEIVLICFLILPWACYLFLCVALKGYLPGQCPKKQEVQEEKASATDQGQD